MFYYKYIIIYFILMKKNTKAFTLVEIAIVVVVISIMMTVIIMSKRLIYSSYANQHMIAIRSYQSAITIFRNTFDTLPGDIPVSLLTGTANTAAYHFTNTPNGNAILDSDYSNAEDELIVGCDNRDGFKQMALTGILPNNANIGITSHLTPSSMPQCSLLDSTNTQQSLSIFTDIGISLPTTDSKKEVGVYYGTMATLSPNNHLIGTPFNDGEVIITLFGAKDPSLYA